MDEQLRHLCLIFAESEVFEVVCVLAPNLLGPEDSSLASELVEILVVLQEITDNVSFL